MPDPTGRWLNGTQWQCPKCGFVNGFAEEKCQNCGASVRPDRKEPVRPPDPLDLISHDSTRAPGTSPLELATQAVHTLTRVTREKAAALIGHGLRSELEKRGETGGRAWQAIAEMPESDQRALLDSVVDHLERSGVALYRFNGDERA
jgi:hypothetical protein